MLRLCKKWDWTVTDFPSLGPEYYQVRNAYTQSRNFANAFRLLSFSFKIFTLFEKKKSAGKLSGGVNKEGIKYYNNLINELLSKGT